MRNWWQWLRSFFRAEHHATPEIVATPPAPVVVVDNGEEKPKRTRGANVEPLRREVADVIADLIDKVHSFNADDMFEKYGRYEYAEALGDLLGCDFHFIGKLAERMEGASKYYHNPRDEGLTELMWPIDVASCIQYESGSWGFQRLWTADPASMRGKVRIVPARVAWLSEALFKPDGEWFAQKSPMGLINERWVPIDQGIARVASDTWTGPRYREAEYDIPKMADECAFMQSVALTERYSWHVALGRSDGPRILLPTNPKGCLAFFKSRAKQENETRRAALRHWVQNHYRESSEDDYAYVRDHLRGETKFNWRDFGCEIFVSQFDLEKNEFFKNQAHEWRAQRKHNRVRIRIKRKHDVTRKGEVA